MPRQARESSGTGIYHVMMRGINHQNIFEELNELVNEPLSDDVACIDMEDASKGRPSDDQIELKGKRASLRQLERLTGISKSMIYRMG